MDGGPASRVQSDVPTARVFGTALHQLEQAVAGADIPPAVSLKNNGRAHPADAGIDNAEKDSSRRKPRGRCSGIADRRIGKEVDNGCAWRHLVQHRLHLTRVRAV
jgi:hypothetical protein